MGALSTPVEATGAATRLRDQLIAGLLVALALFILYAVFLDQGALLSPLYGELSRSANYLHELSHDGRHLFAANCH
ncbi:CbtB-domain containing protein [Catellatospora bangladeshensis]|uniref:CbtB-domain containing protein n=1 Tax=Catellatospora bangladeshensis TaxID=310355 RepID=A0A8J3NM31_9ACTN|nr:MULTISPECIES: CbtB-domain containing protein [Catellatospora]BCJ70729.1 hypothetical protein CS0771_02730 [Catellatospora sp. IY07-71]GIF83225.1 hypothetical protein Cba03nite_45740 [Catellatospora bangladeshensis]